MMLTFGEVQLTIGDTVLTEKGITYKKPCR
jgi:hypothetical protein